MNTPDPHDPRHRYAYAERLLAKFPDLRQRFAHNVQIPDQVEVHLPPRGRRLCWLDCPHCFTHSGRADTREALPRDRLLALLDELADGHPVTGERPEKLIIAGFNTDPLNSDAVGAVALQAKARGFVLGLHSKGLRIAPDLAEVLTHRGQPGDYISFSIDAGSDRVYNAAHGVRTAAPLYARVRSNIRALAQAKRAAGSGLRITATYLITRHNASVEEVRAFAADMFGAGVDHLRFSRPIRPVMGREDRRAHPFPGVAAADAERVREAIATLQGEFPAAVHLLEFPECPVRTLPCWSRWLMPTIGQDGYLYPCCLTASGQFAALRLADLRTTGFWAAYQARARLDFQGANCQCDRKATAINAAVRVHLSKGEPANRDPKDRSPAPQEQPARAAQYRRVSERAPGSIQRLGTTMY